MNPRHRIPGNLDASLPPEEPLPGAAALRSLLTTYRGLKLEAIVRIVVETEFSLRSGNVTMTARALGVGRTTLYRRLERYGLATSRTLIRKPTP